MTTQKFVEKWRHLLTDRHPDYSARAGILFWCASYDTTADFIPELVEDFLGIPRTEGHEGMSYRRALRISRGEEV